MAAAAIKTVAILGTGDMGSAVGHALSAHGLQVFTCLQGRSEDSRKLALDAGMQDTASLEEMFSCADVFLSIVPPAAARAVAEKMCPIIRQHSPETLVVE